MNIVNRIKNLFLKNKTDFICPECNKNLYLIGQLRKIGSNTEVYLRCKSCNKEYIVEKC